MRTKLREARKQMGLSQSVVAQLAGISLKSYQRIEKGEQDPRASVAIRVAKSVNGTVETLFGAATPDKQNQAGRQSGGMSTNQE